MLFAVRNAPTIILKIIILNRNRIHTAIAVSHTVICFALKFLLIPSLIYRFQTAIANQHRHSIQFQSINGLPIWTLTKTRTKGNNRKKEDKNYATTDDVYNSKKLFLAR